MLIGFQSVHLEGARICRLAEQSCRRKNGNAKLPFSLMTERGLNDLSTGLTIRLDDNALMKLHGRREFLACAVLECFFRMTLGLDGLGFVQIVGADGSIGEQGNQRRLHFEYATGNLELSSYSSRSGIFRRTVPGLTRVSNGV